MRGVASSALRCGIRFAARMSKNKPHLFDARIAGYLYCVYCGLMALNNDATRKAIKCGCASRD